MDRQSLFRLQSGFSKSAQADLNMVLRSDVICLSLFLSISTIPTFGNKLTAPIRLFLPDKQGPNPSEERDIDPLKLSFPSRELDNHTTKP